MYIIRQDFVLRQTHTHTPVADVCVCVGMVMPLALRVWATAVRKVRAPPPSLSSPHTAVLFFLSIYHHITSSIFSLPHFSYLYFPFLCLSGPSQEAPSPPSSLSSSRSHTEKKVLGFLSFTFFTNCALPHLLSSCFTEAIGQ